VSGKAFFPRGLYTFSYTLEMSFEFLTDEHLRKYGRYHSDPTPEQLSQHFYLTHQDLQIIQERRKEANRLGFALQLCTLRFLGTFLSDPLDAPDLVLTTLAKQLKIVHPRSVLKHYATRVITQWEHYPKIRDYLGYSDFAGVEILHLTRWIYSSLLIKDERPIVLFDLIIKKLSDRKTILPGATVLARLIVKFREHLNNLVYHKLTKRLTPEHKTTLNNLLIIPENKRKTPLEVLRTPPVHDSSKGLLTAIDRLETIKNLNMGSIDTRDIPSRRLDTLARHALLTWTGNIAKLSEARRYATLLVTIQYLEKTALDDVLDVFEVVMSGLGIKSRNKRRKERIRTLKDLDAASILLGEAVSLVLDSSIADSELRNAIFKHIQQSTLQQARDSVHELTSGIPKEDIESWTYVGTTIQRFLSRLLQKIPFEGLPNIKPVLAALAFYQKPHKKGKAWKSAPTEFIPSDWKSLVILQNKEIDPHYYAICLALELQNALKKREVFVVESPRYGDPRAQLLSDQHWLAVRDTVCRTLDWSLDPKVELEHLQSKLDQAYTITNSQLEGNTTLRMELQDGIITPIITPLEALEIPVRLRDLQTQMEARLPEVDLSEMMLEMQAFCGFADEFTNRLLS